MIGGMIVLTLFLTALVAMVLVSQQFDTYQSTAASMSQRDIARSSEKLQAVYPGLKGGFPATGCGGQCNQYNMSLANTGTIGVQITQIYINSTQQTTGCTVTNTNVKGPCVFGAGATITSFVFNSFDSYLYPGEVNHIVRLWVPQPIVLPNATFVPSNTIWVATTRGRVFSFAWPFPAAGQGLPGAGVPPTIYTGTMRVAFNGTHRSTNQADTCNVAQQALQLPAGGSGNTLNFVNPWITSTVMDAVGGGTNLYVYAYATNSLATQITFSWGEMVILVADSSDNSKAYFIGGPLVGIVYNQTGVIGRQFSPGGNTPVNINPGSDFYLIFQIQYIVIGSFSGNVVNGIPGDSFSGTATVNNGFGSQNPGATFREIEIFLNGLYVRSNC